MSLDAILKTIITFLPALLDLAPEIATGIETVIKGHRPDLLPAPPASAAKEIEAEDAAVIAERFPNTEPAPAPTVEP